MDSKRFERIREIVIAALELAPAERAAYLEEACRGDSDLKTEVESLLAQDDGEARIVRTGGVALELDDDLGALVEEVHDKTLPKQIGGYEIVGMLGEGGMGVVYEAVQQSTQRPVALKVARGGTYLDEHQIKLFQREIRTLALLKHPRIAAVYEAGRTEEGRHFFAMELVRGVPLDEYLRSQGRQSSIGRREIRARLALFLKICDAITYAHQRGVIHRDLKPSNILVVRRGQVDDAISADRSTDGEDIKILDFGLARMTDADVTITTMVKDVRKIQGTLAYMSPEQAQGNPDEIDLRSDVYALGVVLYEMLTGERPYDIQRNMIHEAIRVICEEAPRRPSSTVRVLRGDVETIALKALEKEPGRRYQTVLGLAEDIQRFMSNQPILARSPSATYQFRKLVARHKGLFAFATTLFILLAVFGIIMSVLFESQRRETRKADRINAFLQEMLSSVKPAEMGREVTVREVLDETAMGIATGLEEEPEVQAAVRATIGNTYAALGEYEAAEPLLVTALNDRRRVLGDKHRDVANSLSDYANLKHFVGEYAQAESLHRAALEMRTDIFGDDHPAVAASLQDLGLSLKFQSNYAVAESLFHEALAMRRRHQGPEHPEIARILNHMAAALSGQGRLDEAEISLREGLAMRERLFGEEHPDVATSTSDLAYLLGMKGKYEEAISLTREAQTLWVKILGEEHPTVARNLNNLAYWLSCNGKQAEAERYHRECLAMRRKLLDEDHPDVVGSINNLAVTLIYQAKYTEAEPHAREALRLFKKLLGEEHEYVATALNNVGYVLMSQDKYPEAEPFFLDALALQRKIHGEKHHGVALALCNLGVLYHQYGRRAEAEPLLREALAMRREVLGDEHDSVGETLARIASILLDRDQNEEAEPLLRESVSIYEKAQNTGPWTYGIRSMLGVCLARLDQRAEAESLLAESRAILIELPRVGWACRLEFQRAAAVYEAWGDSKTAELYREALKRLQN
ncbi:tetratricopeptide repeat protein [Candidatus Eisenbacteria bacterium]|uniref:Tetratricopeptide repeat protein n=1 Tax=Eiseniibacteriota bacterium TaxID=2212470 RepID=A0ABV6YJJ2_UNCEI